MLPAVQPTSEFSQVQLRRALRCSGLIRFALVLQYLASHANFLNVHNVLCAGEQGLVGVPGFR